jgi:hypothetical protein
MASEHRPKPRDAQPTPRKRGSERSDDANAFVPDPLEANKPGIPEPDAESFAEEFITSATAAEPVEEDARDEVVDEEQGGPFLIETVEEETIDAADIGDGDAAPDAPDASDASRPPGERDRRHRRPPPRRPAG